MEKVCILCGKNYKPTRWGQKYCSIKCLGNSKRKEVQTKKCINCGNEFVLSRRNSQKMNDSRLYCSKSCAYHGSERNKKISKARIGKFIGEENGKWKGGKTICNGYARISKTGKRLHRIVMENHLGRKLSTDEIVHHINENPLDNRIENLQVMSQCEHNRLHKKGKVSWAKGLTKDSDDRIKKISEAKKGKPRFNIRGKNHWSYKKIWKKR